MQGWGEERLLKNDARVCGMSNCVPFTTVWKTEGQILWGGSLSGDEEFLSRLVEFETSREMSRCHLCVQVHRAKAELGMGNWELLAWKQLTG